MAKMTRGAGGTSLGALGRSLDIYHAIGTHIVTNFSSGAIPAGMTAGWSGKGGIEIGAAFPNGAGGFDGIANNSNAGRPHLFFNPAVGVKDHYCAAATCQLDMLRPLVKRVNPFAVWEFEADLLLRLPAGAIAGDFGMVLHCDTATTGFGVDFTNGGGLFAQGLALMAQGADNQIHALARGANGVGFGRNVATGIIAQAPGAAVDRFRRYRIRLESATVSADPKVTFYVDDAAVSTMNLTPGDVTVPNMSIAPPAGAQNWLGTFRCFLRSANNNVSGAVLAVSHWRVSAAPSVAAMGT